MTYHVGNAYSINGTTGTAGGRAGGHTYRMMRTAMAEKEEEEGLKGATNDEGAPVAVLVDLPRSRSQSEGGGRRQRPLLLCSPTKHDQRLRELKLCSRNLWTRLFGLHSTLLTTLTAAWPPLAFAVTDFLSHH